MVVFTTEENQLRDSILARQTYKFCLDNIDCDTMKPIKYFRASKHNLEILEKITNQSEFIRDAINFFFKYGTRRKDFWCKKKHKECLTGLLGNCKSNPNYEGTYKAGGDWDLYKKVECPHRKSRNKVWYSQKHFERRSNMEFEPYEVYTKEELDLIIHDP